MAHFAPRVRHDDEETVTRPLLRPSAWMLPGASLRTDRSIELEPVTEPRGSLPDFSDDEWISTNELPRPPSTFETTITRPRHAPTPVADRPLPLVRRAGGHAALPPLSPLPRRAPSRPALPPVPAFTRPIVIDNAPGPLQKPRVPAAPASHVIRFPDPKRRQDSIAEIEVREDLRVDWARIDAVPTSPVASGRPGLDGYRPRQETMRGIELVPQRAPVIQYAPEPPPAPPAPPTVVIDPRAERISQVDLRPPISEVPAFAVPAQRQVSASRQKSLKDLWRAAKGDAWTAFLMLPIAVSVVSIVVLTVTALASSPSEAAGSANRRVVTASDPNGAEVTTGTAFVDGVAKCQSLPCALDLPDGTHWITVAAPGFDAPGARAVVIGEEGPEQIDFVLAPSTPAPAPVPVATSAPVVEAPLPAPVAATPAPEPARAPARSVPEASPVYEPGPTPLPAEPAVVRPVERAAGSSRLNINSIPASNVVLDGRPLGRTPKLGVSVQPGAHTVVFINGKKRVVQSAVVKPGKTAVIAARL